LVVGFILTNIRATIQAAYHERREQSGVPFTVATSARPPRWPLSTVMTSDSYTLTDQNAILDVSPIFGSECDVIMALQVDEVDSISRRDESNY